MFIVADLVSASVGGGGSGGNSPIFFLNGASWRNLSVPKYIIINLKINNFKDHKSAIVKIIRHTFQHFTNTKAE